MRANIAELCSDTEEKFELFAQGLVNVACKTGALFGLEGHVGVCEFWDRREGKDDGEEEDEGGGAEVGPLHVGEVVGAGAFEEHTGCQQWGHDGADGLERL